MPGTLYVVGNGFDLNYRIPSSYFLFGEYLRNADHLIYRAVEDYLAFDDDFWSHFEARLADLDADSVLQDAQQYFVGYSDEGWSDAYHHDYQFEIERVVQALSEGLKTCFTDWIRQLRTPSRAEVGDRLVRLDATGRFLTFNYTPTLQLLHGIDAQQVLHIHGKAGDSGSELVLGHGWNPNRSRDRSVDPEQDMRVTEGDAIVDDYFRRTFKPTAEIIARHTRFFEELGLVERISVMGHSMADVDLPYFEEIVRNIDKDRVRWKISYFGSPQPIEQQFRKLGVDIALAEFATLANF